MAQRSNLSDETYLAILDRVADGELVTEVVREYGCSRKDVWRKSEEEVSSISDSGAQVSLVSPSTYMRARISQMHSMAEDTVLIADGLDDAGKARTVAMVQSLDGVKEKDKQRLLDSLAATAVARDTLRVNTRKFLMAKIAPKIYGDTTRHVELTGKDGAPIQVEDVGQLRDSLTARLAGIASRRKLLTATARVIEDEPTDVELEPDTTAE